MSASVECPGMECWQALFYDALPAEERDRCERHLEACPRCQECLDHPEAFTEELRMRARRLGDPTLTPPDATWSVLLERLHGVPAAARVEPAEPADLYFLRPSDRPGVLGTLGNYEVCEVIGQGGMGVVLKAFDPALHRFVAIKVMAAAVAGSVLARKRFTREAQAAAAVAHDHVVAVHGVYEIDGLPYQVMQYIAGESLQERIDRAGPLEVEEVVRIGQQTAAGLAAAHAQGLIHRDIKPANLLLENGVARVKITDFGLARMVDDVGLTQTGVVAGTPEYMAPEQARGEPIDHRADLFSLGGVLYACCTGGPPFRAASAVAVLRRVSDETPASIRARNPQVPAWLETLIARLMAKAPADRFQTAAEVAALLEGYLAHLRRPTTIPVPPLPPAPARRRFAPGRWLFALVLLAAGLAGAGALLFQAAPHTAPPPSREFFQDFRGGQAPLPPLHLAGADAQTLTRPEAEGFRITLPRGPKQPARVGLEMKTRIKGDFEITSTYEILEVGQPVQGHGVAFALFVETDSARRDVVELARSERVTEGEVYNCARVSTDDQGKRTYHHEFPPAAGTSGRLRLTRTGREVTLSAAEGAAGDFKQLTRYDLGTEDVTVVNVSAFTGYAPNTVDLRILDLRVRGLSATEAAALEASETGPKAGRTRAGLTAAAIIGLLLALMAVVVWLIASRRRRPEGEPLPAHLPPTRRPGPRAAARRIPARLGLLLLLPAALAGGLLAWGLAGEDPAPRQESDPPATPGLFHQDFRTADFDRDVLQPLGGGVERDEQGLRITLDAGPDARHNTGFNTAFAVRGDFEITVAYAVLGGDRPTTGYGIGVGLYAPLDPAAQDAVSLARRLFPDGSVQFVSNRMTSAGGKVKHRVKKVPSTAAAGKLRLQRVGAVLRYFVADGADASFVLIEELELGTADLRLVRVEGDAGGSEAGLDARFLDFAVRAADLPGLPDAGTSPAGAPRLTKKGWLTAAALLGLMTALALLGRWLVGQRRQPPAPDTQEKPAVSAPLVAVACPGCGRGLKFKAELAGKKGKCPRCGGVVHIPGPT